MYMVDKPRLVTAGAHLDVHHQHHTRRTERLVELNVQRVSDIAENTILKPLRRLARSSKFYTHICGFTKSPPSFTNFLSISSPF